MKVSSSVWIQLQNITYDAAIDRYKYLKTRFLNEYATAANIEDQYAQDMFEETLAQTLNNDIDSLHRSAEVKNLYSDIANLIAAKLRGDKAARLEAKKIKEEYRSGEKGAKAQAEKTAEALGETLISEEELKAFVIQSLSRYQVGTSFPIEDIISQVKGYRTKVLTRSKSMKRAVDITKGYYQEALVYKAFNALASSLDMQLTALPAGAIKVDGKDTLYDTYLRFFNQIDGQAFTQIVSEKLDIGYGLQSKSWTLPWMDERPIPFGSIKYGFSIGSRKALLTSSGLEKIPANEYIWFEGVSFLERNAVIALGENQVGFITKNGFTWTADLIALFRAMDYFLAFGYKAEKPLTPKVSWTPVLIDTA